MPLKRTTQCRHGFGGCQLKKKTIKPPCRSAFLRQGGFTYRSAKQRKSVRRQTEGVLSRQQCIFRTVSLTEAFGCREDFAALGFLPIKSVAAFCIPVPRKLSKMCEIVLPVVQYVGLFFAQFCSYGAQLGRQGLGRQCFGDCGRSGFFGSLVEPAFKAHGVECFL